MPQYLLTHWFRY